jgi:hypothetical protein
VDPDTLEKLKRQVLLLLLTTRLTQKTLLNICNLQF